MNSAAPTQQQAKRENAFPVFRQLVWQPDRVLLGDLVFRLVHTKSEDWTGPPHFMFYKLKGLIDAYAEFLDRTPDFAPKNIMELGIYDGGSTAFWYEVFHPRKLIGIDLMQWGDSAYFREYVESRALSARIATHWGVDQADKNRLRAIAKEEFQGPIDLVIDDCSHLYEPTLASFEALFPSVRPGGFYVIEDWAWAHQPRFNEPTHPWAYKKPLTTLAAELATAVGNARPLIKSATVVRGFLAIERGSEVVEEPEKFSLEKYLVHRPNRVAANQKASQEVLQARLRHWAQIAMPFGSTRRRIYQAAKRAVQALGIIRPARGQGPPSAS